MERRFGRRQEQIQEIETALEEVMGDLECYEEDPPEHNGAEDE